MKFKIPKIVITWNGENFTREILDDIRNKLHDFYPSILVLIIEKEVGFEFNITHFDGTESNEIIEFVNMELIKLDENPQH